MPEPPTGNKETKFFRQLLLKSTDGSLNPIILPNIEITFQFTIGYRASSLFTALRVHYPSYTQSLESINFFLIPPREVILSLPEPGFAKRDPDIPLNKPP